jgi:hypothetical protein
MDRDQRNQYARERYRALMARAAATGQTPRARRIDVPRRCPDCGAAVLLQPTGGYIDERTNAKHRCRKGAT